MYIIHMHIYARIYSTSVCLYVYLLYLCNTYIHMYMHVYIIEKSFVKYFTSKVWCTLIFFLLYYFLFHFLKMLAITHWVDLMLHQHTVTHDQKNTGLVSVKCVTTGSQEFCVWADRDFRIPWLLSIQLTIDCYSMKSSYFIKLLLWNHKLNFIIFISFISY